MKFKFAPKGEYSPGQRIIVDGTEYVVEHLSASGLALNAVTTNLPAKRILVVLTDEPPIEEIKPPPGYTAAELDRDNPFNQWMYES